MSDVPVAIVTSIDPVLRDSAVSALLLDLPQAVAVRHDITPDGVLRRVVHDWSGVRDRHSQALEHGCLSCALREDLLPVLRGLVNGPARESEKPQQIIVGLPVSSDPAPLINALMPGPDGGLVPGARVAAVAATASAATLTEDLFGDDLLAERGQAFRDDDRRSVGEALAAQLESADVVLLDAQAEQAEHDLIDHLAGPGVPRTTISAVGAAELFAVHRDPDDPRGDLLRLSDTQAPDTATVWSLDLASHKAFHPDRLHAEIEALGTGPIRARGTFWLPGRPEVIGLWDGAGGQLSIGAAGTWPGAVRTTRLRVTGIGPQRRAIQRAFQRALMTDQEMEQGLDRWDGLDDGFGPWMGDQDADIDDLSA
ncbi:CobW family GTP-binding protein [Kineosporia babensis]|uniref:GTP-binding protein n=1 Tax=Kineosporia babensis TaxID=499548 RepID=A0A9X1T1R6_9ACTN|nr:GTP-binding protein [Kineosporia babensis]MCD5313918.1 GTP-binding protein [Kineosporia babensis]